MNFFGQFISRTAAPWMLAFLLSEAAVAAPDGPTLQLGVEEKGASTNSMEAFMYFVPLISPEPVSNLTSPGSTQLARLTAASRHVSGNSFSASCEMEFTGAGWQKSIFDLSYEIHRHEQALKDGGTLAHMLKSIALEGAGVATMEVEGTVSAGAWTVSEVRLRFNAHGQASPVTIELCDVKYLDGDFRQVNGVVAKVNTLTFRRQAKAPKMEVTVASIRNKDAGDGIWQSLKGKVEGAAVNMFLPPLPVEEVGNRAMLDFGLALISGAPTFTFPLAKNLKQGEKQPER
jgi:hypothetical protein